MGTSVSGCCGGNKSNVEYELNIEQKTRYNAKSTKNENTDNIDENNNNNESYDNIWINNECFWNESLSLSSHNLLIKKWEKENKLEKNWKNNISLNKDTSSIYSYSFLNNTSRDEYGTKHLNSIYYKHPNYILSRRDIQHDIIDIFINKASLTDNITDDKWIIFIGGASCIGKSYIISKILQSNLFSSLNNKNCIISNHDLIRPLLPEWELYLNNDNVNMYDLLYTEVIYLFQCIMFRGLNQNQSNILIDGTMKNYGAYQRFINIIKKYYNNYKIGFIFVEPKQFDLEIIQKRLKKRYKNTSRKMPIHIIVDSYNQSIKTYNKLNNEYDIDMSCRIINLGENNDINDTPFIFEHYDNNNNHIKCKLKHLIKWKQTIGQNELLLDNINEIDFKTQIDNIVKQNL